MHKLYRKSFVVPLDTFYQNDHITFALCYLAHFYTMHLIWNNSIWRTTMILSSVWLWNMRICFLCWFHSQCKKKIFRQSNTCFPLKVTILIWLNLSWKWQKTLWQNIRNLEHIKSDIVYKTWTWFSPLTYFYPFDEQWIEGKQ